MSTLSAIPTNLITGFLGVGKTTAIIHLLQAKPADEHWAVLVNEFGEIGIDGTLIKQTGAQVREVPGGCICCVAGLPMKMALNLLVAPHRLRGRRPDRLLIEPTGLGHPSEILATITHEEYREILEVRASLTLVDPRKLSDANYTEHQTYRDQIQLADVLIANKIDLCSAQDLHRFDDWVKSAQPAKTAAFKVVQGDINPAWLDLPRSERFALYPDAHASFKTSRLSPAAELYNTNIQLPEGELFLRREQSNGEAFSCGWLIAPQVQFNFNQVFGWLTAGDFLRAKAVLNTDQGWFSFNSEDGLLSVNPMFFGADASVTDKHGAERPGLEIGASEIYGLEMNGLESRIEFIHWRELNAEQLQNELFACTEFELTSAAK